MDSVLNLKVQFLWDTWKSHEMTWIRCFFFLPSFGLFYDFTQMLLGLPLQILRTGEDSD